MFTFCAKFQVLNYFIDCYDWWYERCALEGRPSITLSIFLQSVITWPKRGLYSNSEGSTSCLKTLKLYVIADIWKV
jgi:hypothetical protein